MAEQDLDRNESATPFKLEKARQRGQVAKSADVASSLVFAVAAVYFAWQGTQLLQRQFQFDHALIVQASRLDASGATLWPIISRTLSEGLHLLTPGFLALMLAAVAGNLVQTGPIFSMDPIKMDWQRLNPKNGLERIFSMRTIFDLARACIKLTVLCFVAYLALSALLPHFYDLASKSPLGYVHELLNDLGRLGLQMAVVLGIIAALDLLYTRREFAKRMRMSRRELTDEFKHREGDPRIRSRLRQLRREMLKKSLALRKTAGADVLITNPTHFAVALRYEQKEMNSPQLVAKGSGQLAAAMREIAARHSIPIVQNPPLARSLYRELDVEHHVPPHLYGEVARIIVWIFAMRERVQLPKSVL